MNLIIDIADIQIIANEVFYLQDKNNKVSIQRIASLIRNSIEMLPRWINQANKYHLLSYYLQTWKLITFSIWNFFIFLLQQFMLIFETSPKQI